jgi:hypothetical protein
VTSRFYRTVRAVLAVLARQVKALAAGWLGDTPFHRRPTIDGSERVTDDLIGRQFREGDSAR